MRCTGSAYGCAESAVTPELNHAMSKRNSGTLIELFDPRFAALRLKVEAKNRPGADQTEERDSTAARRDNASSQCI